MIQAICQTWRFLVSLVKWRLFAERCQALLLQSEFLRWSAKWERISCSFKSGNSGRTWPWQGVQMVVTWSSTLADLQKPSVLPQLILCLGSRLLCHSLSEICGFLLKSAWPPAAQKTEDPDESKLIAEKWMNLRHVSWSWNWQQFFLYFDIQKLIEFFFKEVT